MRSYTRDMCVNSAVSRSQTSDSLTPGPEAQLVASPTADTGVASSILALSHTLVEIAHKIISTVILLLPLIKEGLLSVTGESMCSGYWLTAYAQVTHSRITSPVLLRIKSHG